MSVQSPPLFQLQFFFPSVAWAAFFADATSHLESQTASFSKTFNKVLVSFMVHLWRGRYFTMMPFQMCVFYQLLQHKSLHQQHHSPLIDPIRIKKIWIWLFVTWSMLFIGVILWKKGGKGKKLLGPLKNSARPGAKNWFKSHRLGFSSQERQLNQCQRRGWNLTLWLFVSADSRIPAARVD